MTEQPQQQQEEKKESTGDALVEEASVPKPIGAAASSSKAELPKSIWKHSRSYRVLVGDAKQPGAARNMMIAQIVFSGVTIAMLLVTSIRSISLHKAESEKDFIIAKLKEELLLQASSTSEQRKVPLNCNLYMAPSTLPTDGAGISLFATHAFPNGQVIIDNSHLSAAFTTTADTSNVEFQRIYCQHSGLACVTTRSEGGATDALEGRETSILLPHLATLIKPHPYLKNVQLLPGTQQLIAVRPISPGEELFSEDTEVYSQQQYPPHIAPTLHHYRLANKIYHDLRDTLSSLGRNIARNINQPPSPRSAYVPNPKTLIKKSQQEFEHAQIALQKLVHQTVSNLDNVTASLLPTTSAFTLPSAYASEYHAMKNHSIQWLDQHSRCYDDTIYPKLKKENGEVVAVAKRFIAKSEVFTVAPVLVIYLPNKLPLPNEFIDKYCLTHHHSDVIICFSSYASYMIRHPSSCTAEGTSDSNTEPLPSYCSNTASNAKYSWSPRNLVNDKYLKMKTKNSNQLVRFSVQCTV
jgi:hypothetical protein